MLGVTFSTEFRKYLKVLKSRRRIVILFFLTVVGCTTVLSYLQKDVFRGTVTLDIGKDTPHILEVKDIVALGADGYIEYRDYYQTQKEIIKSRSILRKVYESLKLKDIPAYALRSDPLEALASQIKVEEIPDTRLMLIHAEDEDPKFVAELANTVANMFIEHNIERIMSTSASIRSWLSNELDALKEKVLNSDLARQSFKEKYNMVSLEDRQNIVMQNLDIVNAELTKVKSQRIAIETIRNEFIKSKDTDYLFSTQTEDPTTKTMLDQLKTKFIELESNKAELSKKYKDKHPKMIALISALNELKSRINKEINNEYNTAKEREAALIRELDLQKQNVLQLSKLSIEYDALKRDSETNRKMLALVENRFKETALTNDVKTNNIFIHDYTEPPIESIRPKRVLNILASLIIGFFGGLGIALLIDALDLTIKTYDDVKDIISLPLLGNIPIMDTLKDPLPIAEKDTISFVKPQSMTAEAYRSIRTSILYSAPSPDKRKVIVVTSPLSGEGKTTIVTNLALVMAQNNAKVLVVEADMRRPRLYKSLHTKKKEGLSSFLAGISDFESVVKSTEYPNLSLVPSGPMPPMPSELLSSDRMKEFIGKAREKFDNIIFDSPPIAVVTDAAIISNATDGMIVVCRIGKTPKSMLYKMKNIISTVRVPILGLILNDVPLDDEGPDYTSYYYDRYRLVRKSFLARKVELERDAKSDRGESVSTVST